MKAKPLKLKKGWVVVDENKRAVEPLTLQNKVPMYKSKDQAKVAANYYNRKENGNG